MTGDGKILKITCLTALFIGLGSLVYGIVLLVGNIVDYDACVTACEGLLSTVFGARCAILSNVPSNTAKVRKKSLFLLLGAVVFAAYLVIAKSNVSLPQFVIAGIVVLIALCAVFVSSKIVKDQLRK